MKALASGVKVEKWNLVVELWCDVCLAIRGFAPCFDKHVCLKCGNRVTLN